MSNPYDAVTWMSVETAKPERDMLVPFILFEPSLKMPSPALLGGNLSPAWSMLCPAFDSSPPIAQLVRSSCNGLLCFMVVAVVLPEGGVAPGGKHMLWQFVRKKRKGKIYVNGSTA